MIDQCVSEKLLPVPVELTSPATQSSEKERLPEKQNCIGRTLSDNKTNNENGPETTNKKKDKISTIVSVGDTTERALCILQDNLHTSHRVTDPDQLFSTSANILQ